ncbi:Major facilitator superfamily domain, general substrate transporter [Niveomyces insectorum RCEF 264]|uniref:Major facilitator superfamily domain, general substrate transporter n=1 Tax=Niveomyces insectorum RCEF 264 TaxID=1081102 RepID=A0A167S313_9HYPO|nr:Major facilitator superfamily domain, general substrate transporter [Niveomyces insectorum RCEF 264]
MPPSLSGHNLPTWRKYLVLFVVSWMTLVVTFSSTSLLSATPEISAALATTSEVVDITNSGVLVAMGLSVLIWSPLSDVLGRRRIYNLAIFVNFAFSVGVALATDMGMFVAFRLLGGFTGCYFMVAGQTIITDIFEPVQRGRATGFFLVGSVAGPALGPCIAGIIVAFNDWRTIFWLQSAMSGLGLILSVLLIPAIESTSAYKNDTAKKLHSRLLSRLNPWSVFRQFKNPKVFFADLACGFLAITNYGLLACIRAVINPRFNLTTPLISGLFYIAPGIGFILGSVVGGRMSDQTVKRYMVKRDGARFPEDRLNSGTWSLLFVLPASMLLLGWSLEKRFGGLTLPIVAAFFAGVGLLSAFNSLNTFVAGTPFFLYCFSFSSGN